VRFFAPLHLAQNASIHLEFEILRFSIVPRKRNKPDPRAKGPRDDSREAEVRIIGGTFRGRRLQYHGDPVVRPMKHRTREAMFNLISTECTGHHAIDLFAGTGALGLEALSRGAASATFIEKHVPSARIVEQNIRGLEVEDRTQLLVTSAFLWAKRDMNSDSGGWGRAKGEPPAPTDNATSTGAATNPPLPLGEGRGEGELKVGSPMNAATETPAPSNPWLVFCSPPYAFYHDRQQEMLDLMGRIKTAAPPGSILVVETDDKFDIEILRTHSAADPQPGTWDIRAYPPAVIAIWRS
jgi:16S rRNA (guanine966-N2)-methyltransferase